MPSPSKPKIYHITHVNNLANIIESEFIYSDARCRTDNLTCDVVGMSRIKNRRLNELEVTCNPGTNVGEYVPFYFCPRSIMLFMLHKGNHNDITYRGGQAPIVHLQADMRKVVRWAEDNDVQWAFSDRNAGSAYADFYSDLDDLQKLNWDAINMTDFRDPLVKEGKQAEFLLEEIFPWTLVEKIGVFNNDTGQKVVENLALSEHNPQVVIEKPWYY